MLKKLVSLSLCVLLLLSPLTCLAATYTVTEIQQTQLESLVKELKADFQTLSLNSTASTRELLIVKQKLKQSDETLNQVSIQLQLSRTENSETKKLLLEASRELENLRTLFNKYEEQKEKEIKQLKLENTVLKVGIIVLIVKMLFEKNN